MTYPKIELHVDLEGTVRPAALLGFARRNGTSRYKGVAKHDAALDQVIADMESGKISVLVVWQSSRIERRGAYNAFDLARRVREAGGRIEYVKDAHLNAVNDMPDVALAMNATMDRLSSKAKSDAILKKHAALRERKSLIGRPPFGFVIVCEQCGRSRNARHAATIASCWCRTPCWPGRSARLCGCSWAARR